MPAVNDRPFPRRADESGGARTGSPGAPGARRPAGPAFKADTPYVIALVDLDEGPRMMARVAAPPDRVRIGQRVEMVFDDVTESVTLPGFRLAVA